jgi:hypothetical protein
VSAIRAYARARAAASGFAVPVASVRHVHVAERPLVFVPLSMAGQANAPLAAMVGTDPGRPDFLVVPQPRDLDLRFGFAAELADILLPYVDSFAEDAAERPNGKRSGGAPQLVVPNSGGVGFVRLLGRSTRFRRTEGDYAVEPSVPLLGRWLTFFAERAEHPGSSMMLAATDALALHWATGQSAIEDANLAVLMGWLAPPHGSTGAQAARLAENPAKCPPAGPATDPRFDEEKLVPAIAAYDRIVDTDPDSPDSPARRAAVSKLEALLRGQLEPTWKLMWQALARLRELPAAASVAGRWEMDRASFAGFHEYLAEDGPPQARRDGAVAAARRLNRMEQAQAALDAERAFDDPLVMADQRIGGEAFTGTVVAVDHDRQIRTGSGRGRRFPRPLITVRTQDPVSLTVGTKVVAVTRRQQDCVIHALDPRDDHLLVTVEARSGMGRKSVPEPGTVAGQGETLCYTSVLANRVLSLNLPEVADTPWTHGGPPALYEPNADDAGEDWQ